MSQVSCSRSTRSPGLIALHSTVNTAVSAKARRVRFLAQENNNSRSACQGSEPEIFDYQTNAPTTKLPLPLINVINCTP